MEFYIFRTEREVSVEATPQPRENANWNPADHDFQRSAVEKSVDVANHLNSHDSKERANYAEEAALENEKMSNLARLPRSVDLKYTDQDERSSLYDDYEAKDVAKRGAEDYEEVEEDSPEEDVAALLEEESDEAEKRETRSDARMKRSQATSASLDSKWIASNLLESKDKTSSELRLDPRSLEESEITEDESSSDMKSPRGIVEPSLPDNNALKKLQRSTSSEAISSSSGASAKDTSAEYEKRAEERIQRKIDSIKDEIRRDIEAQRRIRDIQENNAKFDEIQDEESRNFEDDSVKKKRQSVTKKRSIRDVGTDVSSKRILYEEPQRRSRGSGRSNNSPKKRLSHEKPKRSAKDSDESSGQSPSKGFFKKKRERARETILVRKDCHRAEKRHSRSNALPSGRNDGKLRNDLSADLNSYLRVNDGMVRL